LALTRAAASADSGPFGVASGAGTGGPLAGGGFATLFFTAGLAWGLDSAGVSGALGASFGGSCGFAAAGASSFNRASIAARRGVSFSIVSSSSCGKGSIRARRLRSAASERSGCSSVFCTSSSVARARSRRALNCSIEAGASSARSPGAASVAIRMAIRSVSMRTCVP